METGASLRGAADGDIGSEMTATARGGDRVGGPFRRVGARRGAHSLVVILTIAFGSNLLREGANGG